MKYQKYLVLTFIAALFIPMLNAKSTEIASSELNLKTFQFIEIEENIELGFDTEKYLPKSFDPYKANFSIRSLNFIEEDNIELDFNTADYLPENFNPFER